MTSRRSRIKGIANIPQRRKQISSEAELKLNNTEINDTGKDINEESVVKQEILKESIPVESNENWKALDNTISNIESITPANLKTVETSSVVPEHKTQEKPLANAFIKRKLVKIPISKNAINRNRDNLSQNENLQSKISSSDQKEKSLYIQEKSEDEISNKWSDFNIINEEDSSVPIVPEPARENRENIFQKPLNIVSTHSDNEYPLPPPSPNKANRTRIKAVPRLAHRKTSFSASESEDESKKINRIRNDSVCSTTSVITESITECFSPQRQKDPVTAILPKRIGRHEHTRKLAEARREFIRRFGASKPDRQRLTMMDLIFYNPDSNPMTIKEPNALKDDEEQSKDPDDPEEPENVEDPPEPTEETPKSDDEENAMPVPQIKIGPSGEIILDEQSLLIERKDVERQREEMQKAKVVDADNFKTGYGIYKKHQRSKCWTHSETLRFYKALNTIGTDFMLMCELFPNRARRELKMKFKKEEKINRHLVDKALMQPCNFDFEDLKNELEMEERELEEFRKQKEEQKKIKDEKIKENQQKIIERVRKRKAAEMTRKTKTIIQVGETDIEKKLPRKVPHKRPKKEELSIKSFMSDSDADESDLATQSESDEDVVLSRKPTRSGRLPKVVQRYDADELASIDYVMKKNKIPESVMPNKIEPGSVMIITENGPNGEPIYKIYMVTPEQKATELDLSSDVIVRAIQLKKGITAASLMTISANVTDDEAVHEENNVTIPADETVTSLKSQIETCENLEKVQVVATEHGIGMEGLDIINKDPSGVLEVKCGASCSKVSDSEEIRTEENNVTIPADESVLNLRTVCKIEK